MIVSIMTINDVESIEENFCEDFDGFWNVNILKQEIKNVNSKYIVVKDNNNIVLGLAGILITPSDVEIMNIVVKKNSRNQGIGTMLLEELIEMSKKTNKEILTLEVNENNISAIRLYEKFNFEKVGVRKKYYNNQFNAIIMNLRLS